MNNKSKKSNKKKLRKSPIFLIALFNFLIIILIVIYFIYLRFVPYKTIIYDGYAVSGKELANNLLNPNFDVDQSIDALEVKDQDDIYQNLKSYYVGAAKEKNINLDYPIYVNDKLALYNLSKDMKLITTDLKIVDGYEGCTLTSGALYDEHTMERADYNDYIFMKNADNLYINTKEIKINTYANKYTIKMNSVINFTKGFITYYTLEDGKFVYGKILDIDESSTVEVSDFKCKYTYKQLMIALGVMKEEVKNSEENTINENKVEENTTKDNEVKEENKVDEQKPNTNKKTEKQEDSSDKDNNGKNEIKWQKPKVSCSNFTANVYTASTEVVIEDPSNAISKSVTFSFYKDDEISFRTSAVESGILKVTKLIPDTKYRVEGKYQYTGQNGDIYEIKFFTQEFKTAKADKVNPIELSMKNGKIYTDKIEIKNLKIVSNIEDEAINGVAKAQININGVKYSITSQKLKNILQGKEEEYQTNNVLDSDTKYEYEIIFIDTANNEMKLKNNKGNTFTLKQAPSVNLRLKEKDMTSNKINVKLINKDNVQILNYRYELYDDNEQQLKKVNIDTSTQEIYFNDLDPNKVYELKIKGDYYTEDGDGIKKNQEIGNIVFTTMPLGNLYLDVKCDESEITDNSAQINISINNDRTDYKLLKILQNIKIQIEQDDTKQIVQEFDLTNEDINKLSADDWKQKVQDLNSNTKYNVKLSSIAKQGSVTEQIGTEGSSSFETKKQPIDVSIKEVLYTNNLIEFKAIVNDIDGTVLNGNATIILYKVFSNGNTQEAGRKVVKVNDEVLCTYTGLTRGQNYIAECYISKYNETNNENLTDRKSIKCGEFTADGLSGRLKLLGVNRKNVNEDGNLIDIESENNWYSQCFGTLKKYYTNIRKYR